MSYLYPPAKYQMIAPKGISYGDPDLLLICLATTDDKKERLKLVQMEQGQRVSYLLKLGFIFL